MHELFARVRSHRERLTNVAHLFTGNTLASLLALVAFAVTARALGPHDYGQLALIYASVQLIERLFSFQSWQPIIRFGANIDLAEHDEAQKDDMRVLLKFGLVLDCLGAVSGFVVALGAGFLLAPIFGWSADIQHLFLLYCGVLLFQFSGMPTAVQRLAGNFRLLAYGQLVTLAFRATLCLAGLHYSAGIGYFALVWGGTQILGCLTTLAVAFFVLHRQGITGVLTAPLRGVTQRFAGIWGFAWSSNVSLTLWVSSQQLDTLVVGALADPAAAGLYHVAKRVGQLGQKLGGQVQAVLFPDVARLWARGKIAEFKRLILEIEILVIAMALVMVVVVCLTIEPIIVYTAGPEFIDAAPLVIAQMVAVFLLLSGSPIRVSLLSMGRQNSVLRSIIAGTIVFHVTAFSLIPMVGPIGAVIGQIALGTVWLTGLALSLRTALAAHRRASPNAADGSAIAEVNLLPAAAGMNGNT